MILVAYIARLYYISLFSTPDIHHEYIPALELKKKFRSAHVTCKFVQVKLKANRKCFKNRKIKLGTHVLSGFVAYASQHKQLKASDLR